MRQRAWALLVLLLPALLSGCVRIPTNGPVESVPQRTRSAEAPVDIEPQPPQHGADTAAVVYGFLQAMAHSRGDYTVARAFLTKQAALDWQPGRQTLIYADEGIPKIDERSATLTTTLVGRLDDRGTYERLPAQPYSLDFELVQEGDEWRINHPPDGLLLGGYFFHNVFAPVTVYFWDPGFRSLVPDTFYVPRGKKTATLLVQALLAGPSVWLAPAVTSAIPPGTRLAAGTVDVNDAGDVVISLSREVGSLSGEGVSRLARQIAVTLMANDVTGPRPRRLSILQESTPLDVPDRSSDGFVDISRYESDLPSGLQASTDLYAVSNGRIVRVADAKDKPRIMPLPGRLSMHLAGLGALDVNAAATRVAYTVGDSALYEGDLTSPDVPPKLLLTGPRMRPPVYSRFDELWTVIGPVGHQEVKRLHAENIETIPAPALADIDISELVIGPDGVRVLVLGTRDGEPVVGLTLITRDQKITLQGWRELTFSDGSLGPETVVSVGWRDETSLVILGRPKQSKLVVPYVADATGVEVNAGIAPHDWTGVQVVTTPYSDHAGAVVLGSDGRVWRREDDRRWTPYLTDITALAYPG